MRAYLVCLMTVGGHNALKGALFVDRLNGTKITNDASKSISFAAVVILVTRSLDTPVDWLNFD